MSDQKRDDSKQAGTGGSAVQGAPSEEVGHGLGLDPPAAPPDEDGDPKDEAYADRPARKQAGTAPEDESDASAIQRPPADS
ncbi:uncharacterized protein SOCE26_091790 [Sorangium cellulosum]|uniref:Uncharacterized protein n=1 Tax=Sorangium cellulosum TaxID=56 RepID=A0A2L0F810_SORCE|nr:hypothetical protein [Sorangium cellulosum]AUX47657.1 uncharacterized protein SOCE26_091790 [Sorangium cellulosum]